MAMNRRGFLVGLLAAPLAAPAIIKTPGLLMPVRALPRSIEPWHLDTFGRYGHIEYQRVMMEYCYDNNTISWKDVGTNQVIATMPIVGQYEARSKNNGNS